MIKFAGFDIETAGEINPYALQPWRVAQNAGRITSYAAVSETGEVIGRSLNPTLEQLRQTLTKLAAEGYTLVGSNTSFDISWLIAVGLEDEVIACQWADFKFYWKAAQNTPEASKSWGLKAAVAEFFPSLAGYEKEASFDIIDDSLLLYNTIDSGTTAMLARRFYDLLDERSRLYVSVMNRNLVSFAYGYLDGIPISETRLEAWREWAEKKKAESHPKTTLTEKVLASPAQLKRALHEMGFAVASTDKEELSLIEDERVKAIADWKVGAGNISRYITPTEKCLAYTKTGRVHCQPSLWGTYTGRITYSSKQLKKYQVGIAIAQLPRLSPRQTFNPRSVIVPPENHLLAEYDFSNQESRVIACFAADYSGDTTLLDIFNQNKDYHSVMGAAIAGVSYDELISAVKSGDKEAKFQRQLGKLANLALSYRAGWARFQEFCRTSAEVILEDNLCKSICSKYKQTYPGIVTYWRASIELAKQRGYAETRGGRKLFLSEWGGRGAYASEQSALNFPIQGTGADMKYLAVAAVEPMLRAYNARYAFDLHDALFIYLPTENSPRCKMPPIELAQLIKGKLNALPYEAIYGWRPKVPMPVDGKIGESWGELKDLD
jgi:DNA polymerase I-like protein with 3'-5' exonuclease and polymerase domains